MGLHSLWTVLLLCGVFLPELTWSLCFDSNGIQSTKAMACKPGQKEYACCDPGFQCLSNGLCGPSPDDHEHPYYWPFYRGYCSDPTWSSPECNANCNNVTGDGITACSKGYGCCADKSTCNCTTSSFFLGGTVTVVTQLPSSTISWPGSTPMGAGPTISSSTSPTPFNSNTTATAPSHSDSLAIGVKVGIGIGAAAMVTAILAMAIFLLQNRRRRKQCSCRDFGTSGDHPDRSHYADAAPVLRTQGEYCKVPVVREVPGIHEVHGTIKYELPLGRSGASAATRTETSQSPEDKDEC